MLLRSVFKNNNYESAINQNGFVAIPNFLNQQKVRALYTFYKLHRQSGSQNTGMWNSLYDLNRNDANEVSKAILDELQPELSSLFKNYAAPVASFMSKNPNELGVCELHRDFSIMDETKFEYRNVWIPLVDITLENGALYALAGSHKAFNYPLPMFCKWPYTNMQEELFKYIDVFTIKAGDLVVYTDRTLHGSFLNRSNITRPVVHLGVLHENYELAYYFMDTGNNVKVFQVPFSFFFENNFGDQTGRFPILNSFSFNPPDVTLQQALQYTKPTVINF